MKMPNLLGIGAFGALWVFSTVQAATWPTNVTVLDIKKGLTVDVVGKLESGQTLPDISWAARSSVACFPGTERAYFEGKHVFYGLVLPKNSELNVTVTPKDTAQNLSVYAYEMALNRFDLPPLNQVVSCESERKWDRPKKGKTQDHSRVLPKLTALQNPYNVVIAVTGPAEAQAGEFTLSISVK